MISAFMLELEHDQAVKVCQPKLLKRFNTDDIRHADYGACGFAWVEFIPSEGIGGKLDGRTSLGRLFSKVFDKDHKGCHIAWNPLKTPVQSVEVLYAGASLYAQYMNNFFKAHDLPVIAVAKSRLD